MTVHPTSNTDKEYRCVQCGSDSVNIIREGTDPRLKCNGCQMLFNASQSAAAEEAGVIPDGPPPEVYEVVQKTEAATNPREPRKEEKNEQASTDKQEQPKGQTYRIPRVPSFVFISRDRKEVEFVAEKDLVARILNWESRNKNYDLYQLTAKKSKVKVSFDEPEN